MNKCSVPNCTLQSEIVFHSPRNVPQLSLWKKILDMKVDNFYVCDKHFEDKFIRMKKLGVTTDAYPTMYLSNINADSSDICQCCLKSFVSTYFNQGDEFYKISDELQGIFGDVMGCEVRYYEFFD